MPFHLNYDAFDPSNHEPPPSSQPKKPKKPRKAIKSGFARTMINLLVTLVFGAVYFYFTMPAINLHAEDFYVSVFLLCVVYVVTALFTSGFQGEGMSGYFTFVKKQCKLPLLVTLAMVATVALGTLSSWVVIRAGSYQALLPVETGDFVEEVEEISFDQIPMVDRDSAVRLGNRKLGELSDMVSQFEVSQNYTQINLGNRPVRVTPLEYGDAIKWLNNRKAGLPAYLSIDMVTQNVDVIRLDEGMRYSTCEHFSRNLYRHLRFNYPTFMFAAPVFEVNEEGTPYWVCSKLEKTIGLFGGTDIHGAVLVNAITGENEYYENVPEWVDHVYDAELILQQYNYYGQYHNGFINSVLGQRDVTVTTDGYNYIALNGDVFMYTGVTSVTSDQSNVGFILANQRTKETKFYAVSGAEEKSAMASAEGQVQQMQYIATFPLLLNLAEQPTYFMALKDAAGLVKMYAMVNVEQYQIVATGSTVAETELNYRKMLANNNLIDEEQAAVSEPNKDTVSGTVAEIRSAVLDGNTNYFIRLEGTKTFYCVGAAGSPIAVILNVGDPVDITYDTTSTGSIFTAYTVSVAGETIAPLVPVTEPLPPAPEETAPIPAPVV
ncbi:MAG: CvpA family protein [Oscillospiraceae bacterium]